MMSGSTAASTAVTSSDPKPGTTTKRPAPSSSAFPSSTATLMCVKPTWISHDGGAIYSCSVDAAGQRLATGGADQCVKIWSIKPVGSADAERSECPRLLCVMTHHNAAVNVVRFSHSGIVLATASDGTAPAVIIWQRTLDDAVTSSAFAAAAAASSVKPSVSSSLSLSSVAVAPFKASESWSVRCQLRGHSNDICDVSFSPDDRLLASASVDNTIGVWSLALNPPSLIRTLAGHSGWVKGVAWDPVGRYVVSQGFDGAVIVWSTVDWTVVKRITDAFTPIDKEIIKQSAMRLHRQIVFTRISWSPEGSVFGACRGYSSAHIPVTPIYARNNWKRKLIYVGHKLPTTAAAFNPQLFTTDRDEHSPRPSNGVRAPSYYSICAVGSMDNTVTVWSTVSPTPLCHLKGFFGESVTDLSWSADGYSLAISSHDGTIAFFRFAPIDFGGRQVTVTERHAIIRDLHGDVSKSQELLESPMAVALDGAAQQYTKQIAAIAAAAQQQPTLPSLVQRSASAGSSASPVSPEMVKAQQKEIRQANGKRRIIPLALDSQRRFEDPFANSEHTNSLTSLMDLTPLSRLTASGDDANSNPILPQTNAPITVNALSFSADDSSFVLPRTKRAPLVPEHLTTTIPLSSSDLEEPAPSLPSAAEAARLERRSSVVDLTIDNAPTAIAEAIDPLTSHDADDVGTSRPLFNAALSNGGNAAVTTPVKTATVTPTDRPKRRRESARLHPPPLVDSLKKSKATTPQTATNKPPTTNAGNGNGTKSFEQRPRPPPSASKARPAATSVALSSRHVIKPAADRPSIVCQMPSTEDILHGLMSDGGSLPTNNVVEAMIDAASERNNVGAPSLPRVWSTVLCRRNGVELWNSIIPARVTLLAANHHHIVALTRDDHVDAPSVGAMYVLSSTGRRIRTPIHLPALPSRVCMNAMKADSLRQASFVGVLLSNGAVKVWNLTTMTCVVTASVQSFLGGTNAHLIVWRLSSGGMPIAVLSDRRGFIFDASMDCWQQLYDKAYWASDFRSSLSAPTIISVADNADSHPVTLQSLQPQIEESPTLPNALFMVDTRTRILHTLTHLEAQVAAAIAVGSAADYERWLHHYIRKLVALLGSAEAYAFISATATTHNTTALGAPTHSAPITSPISKLAATRIDEITRELLGPIYTDKEQPQPQSSWSARVCGLDKRSLLRSLLPVIATNRHLQQTAVQLAQSLDLLAAAASSLSTPPSSQLEYRLTTSTLSSSSPSSRAATNGAH